jgi:hypothetical protein
MKRLILRYTLLLLFFATVVVFQIGCKKTEIIQNGPCPTVTYPISGLWTGTYVVGAGSPVPAGTAFFFSFSIYPDGKISYKSKGYYNGSLEYITFADGTWTLNGTAFAFSVTTINIPGGGSQHLQFGTATYSSANTTLSAGTITDPLGGSANWSMTRVN